MFQKAIDINQEGHGLSQDIVKRMKRADELLEQYAVRAENITYKEQLA